MRAGAWVIGLAVAASVALNIRVLWTLGELADKKPPAASELTVQHRPAAHTPDTRAPVLPEKNASLLEELAKLNERLSGLEDSVAELEKKSLEVSAVDMTHEALSSRMERLKGGHTRQASMHSEDWFWNSQAGADTATNTTLPDGDSYTVQSMVCRDEWCRAEIQLDAGDATDPEAELELQAALSEAMGKDIEMSFGDRSGNSQVVFIRAD